MLLFFCLGKRLTGLQFYDQLLLAVVNILFLQPL